MKFHIRKLIKLHEIMKMCLVFLLVLVVISVNAQDEVFSLEEFSEILKSHPVLTKAEFLMRSAESEKQIARGGFDPKVEAEWDRKQFDNKNYYSLTGGKFKIPTWFGIDLNGGYKNNSGLFLDDSDELPTRGLWNAGISVPLGKGFLIDERRAELKRADILLGATEQEQLLMINELLNDAYQSYLTWQQTTAYLEIAKEGEVLARNRLNAVRLSFVGGDKPAVDTLESRIALNTRIADRLKAEQALKNARISLENFLWVDGFIPLEFATNLKAAPIDISIYEEEIQSLRLRQEQFIIAHPEILLYAFKFDQLDIDRRLAKETLKPDVRVEYNPLLGLGDNSLVGTFNPTDYTLGVSVNYPIIQRKQRGKLRLIDIKVESTEIDVALKQQQIQTKVEVLANNISQAENQRDIYNNMINDYQLLLTAERRKFEVGESSVFLLNSRERKYLESRYKGVESSVKVIENRLKYAYLLVKMQELI